MSIQIRQAKLSDTDSIVALAHQLGYPINREDVNSRLERLRGDPDHVVLIAELNSHAVAGWTHVLTRVSLLEEHLAEIGGLVIEQNHRRKGIGRKLIQAAEQWAQSKGYTKIVVRSNAVRKEAHDFYPSLGYPAIEDAEGEGLYKEHWVLTNSCIALRKGIYVYHIAFSRTKAFTNQTEEVTL